LKGITTIEIKTPAKMVLEDNSDIIMANTKFGKGTVFAIGNPWIYNEYIVTTDKMLLFKMELQLLN
jgi:unsaturated rhamnogalacturonyl hydrolase